MGRRHRIPVRTYLCLGGRGQEQSFPWYVAEQRTRLGRVQDTCLHRRQPPICPKSEMSVESAAAAAAAAGDHVIRWGNKIRETGDTNNNYTGDIVPDQHDQRMDGDCGSHSLAVPEIGQYLGWAAVLRDIIAVGITFFGPLRGGVKRKLTHQQQQQQQKWLNERELD